ncbi:hypothetical protein GDO81_016548 [Engystomops pustulosus]|uniref:Uncharacterized protein n=1 Tax=Engystomops pustulosus TaxID=76066 RepID=A0AAV7ASX0_ENGPU|nr:hypothetical protein GDO81_016548 [Engystomops pustulosus]
MSFLEFPLLRNLNRTLCEYQWLMLYSLQDSQIDSVIAISISYENPRIVSNEYFSKPPSKSYGNLQCLVIHRPPNRCYAIINIDSP